jgi:hypothetical protein
MELSKSPVIQIIVTPPAGASFTLMTSADATVASVASEIAARTSIPVCHQVLTSNGSSVPLSGDLREVGIKDGSSLQVGPSMVGGCCCRCCTIL